MKSVEEAIAVLEQFEGDDTESLIAGYALADLSRVRGMLNLDNGVLAEILDVDAELESIRSRLERVRDWFGRSGTDLGKAIVVAGIVQVLSKAFGIG